MESMERNEWSPAVRPEGMKRAEVMKSGTGVMGVMKEEGTNRPAGRDGEGEQNSNIASVCSRVPPIRGRHACAWLRKHALDVIERQLSGLRQRQVR
jgi:hypothetical protein